MALVVKNSPTNAGDLRDTGLIPVSGRFPGEGNGNTLQYSWLENPMDSQTWRATAQRVGHNWSDFSMMHGLPGKSLTSVQFSCSVLSDSLWPHDCSMPGFPVHHQLPELAQTHVHRVSDAIQPSSPQVSPSPPTFSLSQHQGLFQWVSSLHQVAKV